MPALVSTHAICSMLSLSLSLPVFLKSFCTFLTLCLRWHRRLQLYFCELRHIQAGVDRGVGEIRISEPTSMKVWARQGYPSRHCWRYGWDKEDKNKRREYKSEIEKFIRYQTYIFFEYAYEKWKYDEFKLGYEFCLYPSLTQIDFTLVSNIIYKYLILYLNLYLKN